MIAPDLQLIEIKQASNRRLHDSTSRRRVTHDEVGQLEIAVHTVGVIESKTEARTRVDAG